MAQIPYGYKIEKGSIVTDTEAAAKIGRFVESYLSGLSVKKSKKAAEIPLSESSLNHLLENQTYLGTEIFPPLITAEVFYSVQKERARRTHPATTTPSDPIPVERRFVFMADVQGTVITGAADIASHLYSMIRSSSDGRESGGVIGRETATGAEINEMRSTAEKMMRHSADQMMQDTSAERIPTWQ